jgi:hypothetical protein
MLLTAIPIIAIPLQDVLANLQLKYFIANSGKILPIAIQQYIYYNIPA